MSEQNSKNSLSQEVLAKIKERQVKPRSRLYFVCRNCLFAASVAFVFLSVSLLVSFIIFILRARGTLFLMEFGWPGIRVLLFSFPWFLVALVLLFVVLLEFLINRFGFAYRRPLIYSIFGVAVVVLSVGALVAATPLHTNAFKSAAESKLPVAGALYRSYGRAPLPPNVFSGRVVEPNSGQEIQIETLTGERLHIQISTSTRRRIINRNGVIKKNDPVMIIGEVQGARIRAFGVKKFEEDETPLFQKGMIKMYRDPGMNGKKSEE